MSSEFLESLVAEAMADELNESLFEESIDVESMLLEDISEIVGLEDDDIVKADTIELLKDNEDIDSLAPFNRDNLDQFSDKDLESFHPDRFLDASEGSVDEDDDSLTEHFDIDSLFEELEVDVEDEDLGDDSLTEDDIFSGADDEMDEALDEDSLFEESEKDFDDEEVEEDESGVEDDDALFESLNRIQW